MVEGYQSPHTGRKDDHPGSCVVGGPGHLLRPASAFEEHPRPPGWEQAPGSLLSALCPTNL
jgi:hypothetical protein